jgi:hypothetical protein
MMSVVIQILIQMGFSGANWSKKGKQGFISFSGLPELLPLELRVLPGSAPLAVPLCLRADTQSLGAFGSTSGCTPARPAVLQ